MIQRVDIKNFGSFSDFVWNNQIKRDGNIIDFKKLNILYGRNYSGKTTLSRVIRSLETGSLPSNYDNPAFSIKTDTGIITPANVGSHGHHVRVFNKDFVDDHLGFLRDDEGNIEPFAILGGDNAKTEKLISEKEKALGSTESKTGLKHDQAEIESKLNIKQTTANNAQSDRTEKLRNKANQEIKQSPQLYGDVNYNIQKIEYDIKTVQLKSLGPLTTEEEETLRALLKQDALPPISSIPSLDLKLSTLYTNATNLLEREIKPTKPIQDLIDDAILQDWAKKGIPLHRDKRVTCGFCGSPLPKDLWDKIDQHFSKESQNLDNEIVTLLGEVEEEERRVASLLNFDKAALYPTLHNEFNQISTEITTAINSYKTELKKVAGGLRMRQSNPFKTHHLGANGTSESEVKAAFAKLIPLLETQTKKTEGLEAIPKPRFSFCRPL